MTQLDNVVYVVCAGSSTILKYNAVSLRPLAETIHINGMRCPMDMVVCRYDRQLYIADYNSCVWRVATDDHSYVKWLPTASATDTFHVTTLSVTSRHLSVTSSGPPSLRQYCTTDGRLVRDVQLPEYVDELNHGIETSRGTFVIGHRGTAKSKEQWAVSELRTLKAKIYYTSFPVASP